MARVDEDFDGDDWVLVDDESAPVDWSEDEEPSPIESLFGDEPDNVDEMFDTESDEDEV